MGFLLSRFSGLRFNWARTTMGTLSSLARALMPLEISEISIWRLSRARGLVERINWR